MIYNPTIESDTMDEADAIREADEGHLQAWHALLLDSPPEESHRQRRSEREVIKLRWLR